MPETIWHRALMGTKWLGIAFYRYDIRRRKDGDEALMVSKATSRRTERMEKTHPEILDVDGAAKVLGVSRWLVLKLARKGNLPGKKIGKEWRFRLNNILRWVGDVEPTAAEQQEKKEDPLKKLLENPRVQLLPRNGK